MTKISTTLLAASALSLTVGCGRADPFVDALPSAADVEIKVPEHQGQALGTGERSELYNHTYNISRGVNAHIGAVFAIIDAIVHTPPSEEGEDYRVWGPSEPRGLDRLSYRFSAQLAEEGVYTYQLEARDKGETSEDAFRTIWDGVARPTDDDAGTGELSFLLDNNDNDCDVGTIHLTYDVSAELRTVDVDFDGVANTCNGEEARAQSYHYSEAADGSGDFMFSLLGNIHAAEEQKPELETMTINSRWLADGSGRGDVVLASSEIEADLAMYAPESGATHVEVTECWNDLFELTYTTSSPEELAEHLRPTDGDPASCSIADAAFPDAVEDLGDDV